MKKFLPLIILFLICGFIHNVKAQDQAIHIAIIPFELPKGSDISEQGKELIQNEVAGAFANKDRFYILDRAQTDKIKNELDRAKDKSSIYASVMAEKGHLAQAEYIISGVVNSYSVGNSTITNFYGKASIVYHMSLRLSLQIVKVETGRTVFSQAYNLVSSDFPNANGSDMTDNLLCRFNAKLLTMMREIFPVTVTILQVDKEKNGLPDQVLINGGKELFDSGKQSNCDLDQNSTMKAFKLTNLFKKDITLDVYVSDVLTVSGKDYQHDKVIGTLKIMEMQGDQLTECKVSDGAQAIKDAMDNKKNILVRVHSDDQNN